jgi:hypothetical protein
MGYLVIAAHGLTVFLAFFVFPFAKIWYNSMDVEEESEGDLEGQEGKKYESFLTRIANL